MRISGGALRGRVLNAPEGRTTRPLRTRVREALFNILMHHDWGEGIGEALDGANVLDAFAGTGALGIEALSRGASFATFFEKDAAALTALRGNIAALGLKDRTDLRAGDVTMPPRAAKPCSLIFLCPPYRKGLIPKALPALERQGWIAPASLIVTETAKSESPDMPAPYVQIVERGYGETVIGFWMAQG